MYGEGSILYTIDGHTKPTNVAGVATAFDDNGFCKCSTRASAPAHCQHADICFLAKTEKQKIFIFWWLAISSEWNKGSKDVSQTNPDQSRHQGR